MSWHSDSGKYWPGIMVMTIDAERGWVVYRFLMAVFTVFKDGLFILVKWVVDSGGCSW